VSDDTITLSPATRFIRVADSGRAHIEGRRCPGCGAVFLQPALACARCGSREPMETFEAASQGKVHTYSVVHRSFPGIRTPFISVIVDLDDGLVLKGNLEGVEPTPSRDIFEMPVRTAFKTLEQTDKAGAPYVTYFFEPA
jgi:uncharacterized OB-fold protein